VNRDKPRKREPPAGRSVHRCLARPAGAEPPQVAAWHNAIYDAALPLLTAARGAGAIRPDLGLMELMALTAAVARAGEPAQAGRFLDILLEGITPRPPGRHHPVTAAGTTARSG